MSADGRRWRLQVANGGRKHNGDNFKDYSVIIWGKYLDSSVGYDNFILLDEWSEIMLMANAVYLNDTSLDVHGIKGMGGREAAVGQGRQVLCDLGELRKSLWRETPPCKGALAKASPGVWSQKEKNSFRFGRNRSLTFTS